MSRIDKDSNVKQGLKLIMREIGKALDYTPKELKFAERFIEDGAQIHQMVELALTKVSNVKLCPLGKYQDYTNGWDMKTAVVNVHNRGKNLKQDRGCTISRIENKRKGLLIVLADPLVNELYFFRVPRKVYEGKKQIFFQFDPVTGGPRKTQTRMRNGKVTISWRIWNEFRVAEFKDLGKA